MYLNSITTLFISVAIFFIFYGLKKRFHLGFNKSLKSLLDGNNIIIEEITSFQHRERKSWEGHVSRDVSNRWGGTETLQVKTMFSSVYLNDAWIFRIKNNSSEAVAAVKLLLGYYDKYGRIQEGRSLETGSTRNVRVGEETYCVFFTKDRKNLLKLEHIIITNFSKGLPGGEQYQVVDVNLILPNQWLNKIPSWPVALGMCYLFYQNIPETGWAILGSIISLGIAYSGAREQTPFTWVVFLLYFFAYYFNMYTVCLIVPVYIGINYLKRLSLLDFFKPDNSTMKF